MSNAARCIGLDALLASIALLAIGSALWKLHVAEAGVTATSVHIGDIPATVFRESAQPDRPVILIAHGFAGSQVLMRSFALAFARNGYVAVTFDFAGHGRNPRPLTGSITDAQGATQVLVAETRRIADFARQLGDGRLAVLGHSMASDIVIRFAQGTPNVAATIAVSMFSPAVTATSPRNLLVIVGDWEGMLKREALRVVALASAPAAPRAGLTYGDPAAGTGRRATFSPNVEHASVLFSQDSLREAVKWADETFHIVRPRPPIIVARGPWIMWLLGGVVLIARPLSKWLPRISDPPVGAGRPWRRLWIPLLMPALVTPLLLRVLPTHFLPVMVADYLAVHFAAYGLLTIVCLALTQAVATRIPRAPVALPDPGWAHSASLAGAGICVVAFVGIALLWPIDAFVTSFVPGPSRAFLILAMLIGTLTFSLSDEWLTRGIGAGRGAYPVSKVLFLASLAFAVALDLERLFFLIIIVPVILLLFIVYGLFSAWSYRRTGHPFVAGIANAVGFAWAIGCTFPLVVG